MHSSRKRVINFYLDPVLSSDASPHCNVSSRNASGIIARASNAAIFSHSGCNTSKVEVAQEKRTQTYTFRKEQSKLSRMIDPNGTLYMKSHTMGHVVPFLHTDSIFNAGLVITISSNRYKTPILYCFHCT